MRRSVTAKESREAEAENFSGVLERMTREGPAHDDRESGLGRRSVASAARRQPVQPLPDTRTSMATEAVTLSYEQALRRHSRRRISDDPAEPGLPETRASSPVTPPKIPQTASPRAGARSTVPAPSRIAARPKPPETRHPPVKAHDTGKARQPSTAKVSPIAAQAGKAGKTANLKDAAQARSRVRSKLPHKLSSKLKPHSQALSSAAEEALKIRRAFVEGQSKADAGPKVQPRKHTAPGPSTRSITRTIPASLDSFPSPAFVSATSAIDQRRTIVSVRLSEEESLRLRMRAAESGISVSAYMRSCVLDADHLRAQVKQALSQMRASIRQPESDSTMQLPAQSGTAFGGAWFRVVTRTAALFLAPLFSLRHRG